MIGFDNKERRIEAERIVEGEITIINENPLAIRPNIVPHAMSFL